MRGISNGKAKWGMMKSRCAMAVALTIAGLVLGGCGSGKDPEKKNDFFTSGSRDADQRASQTMARHEQLEGSSEKGAKEATSEKNSDITQPAQVEGKLALYERLGGEEGITKIVADFMPRVLADPRVNWQRKGVEKGRFFSFRRERKNAVLWSATPQNVEKLQKHFAQFLSLATGGPARYEGKEIKASHAGMRISNAEFDAVIGDLKASLDRIQIPNKEQKELLAIVESTRPQIVTER